MSDASPGSRWAPKGGLTPRILSRIQYHGVALVGLVPVLALIFAGCGLLGGDDEEGDEGGQAANTGGVSPDILTKLAETAAKGGAVPVILEALGRREADRRRLRAELERARTRRER